MKYIILTLVFLTTVTAFSEQSNVESINQSIINFKLQPYSSEINSFVTDKCTLSPQSYLPFTKTEGWAHCCIEHDIAHWAGGNEDLREQADSRLRQCMRNINKPAAEVFYQVVRRLGHPAVLMGNPKGRTSPWGYGWNYYIGHGDLALEQESSVCIKFEQWKETEAFQDFHQIYVGMQGEVPIMPICK